MINFHKQNNDLVTNGQNELYKQNNYIITNSDRMNYKIIIQLPIVTQ